jgi:hypothetical protein
MPPYQPRGGGVILGEVDLCWSLARLATGNGVSPLHEPRRALECIKSRFAEDTPAPLRIERVAPDPASGGTRSPYRLLSERGASGTRRLGTSTRADAAMVPASSQPVLSSPHSQRSSIA